MYLLRDGRSKRRLSRDGLLLVDAGGASRRSDGPTGLTKLFNKTSFKRDRNISLVETVMG